MVEWLRVLYRKSNATCHSGITYVTGSSLSIIPLLSMLIGLFFRMRDIFFNSILVNNQLVQFCSTFIFSYSVYFSEYFFHYVIISYFIVFLISLFSLFPYFSFILLFLSLIRQKALHFTCSVVISIRSRDEHNVQAT